MRTRTSPRNQDILFKALFKPEQEAKPVVDPIAHLEQAIANCWNSRTRRQLERDLQSARHKAAVARALAK